MSTEWKTSSEFRVDVDLNLGEGYNRSLMDLSSSILFLPGVWDKECEPLTTHCSSEWLAIPKRPN
ncbi:unnamed protein product, partial [Rotaria sp. Silwood1]